MSVPIISVSQMREWEKVTWASGQTEEAVIQQAGAAVARFAEKVTQPGDYILVVAGKGHNGDDARLAANQIRRRHVEILGATDPETALSQLVSCLQQRPALVIDGLFGIGLNRPLTGGWETLIQYLNRSGRPILAVDNPSGLQSDLGTPLDDAIRATWTMTMGAVKQGLVQPTAWPFVGRLEVARNIGLTDYPFETELSMVEPADFLDYPPPRAVHLHKGSLGHLCILAGSMGFHGAAVLAARGAQRARPGLITLHTAPEVYQPVAAQLHSVMVHPLKDALALPPKCSAILAGPGLACPALPVNLHHAVADLWRKSHLPMVVDASALAWVPEGPTPRGVPRVLTPHPGEAARLLGTTVGEIQNDRCFAVRELSRRWGGCEVVLKGHLTLTGSQQSPLFLNSSGNPYLAQGGSGDLLAGYLAGLLAQPDLQDDPSRVVRFAVWQHGAAADALQRIRPHWMIEELAEHLGSVPARVLGEET